MGAEQNMFKTLCTGATCRSLPSISLCFDLKNHSFLQLFKVVSTIVVLYLSRLSESLKVFLGILASFWLCFWPWQLIVQWVVNQTGKVMKWRKKEQTLRPKKTVFSQLTARESHTFRKQRKSIKVLHELSIL